jgi:hypothetical protein
MAKAEGVAFFVTGSMALALYPRFELAKDANVSPDGHGFSGVALAYNTRSREEVNAVLAQAQVAGAKLVKAAQEAFWGWIFWLLFRSRRFPVGSRLESVFPDQGGRKPFTFQTDSVPLWSIWGIIGTGRVSRLHALRRRSSRFEETVFTL